MLLLLASSLIPMDRDIEGLQFIIDLKPTIQNLLHIPMYIVLAILFLQILQNYQIEGWKGNILVFLGCGCFGIINEIIQIVVPGRYGGLTDIGLNLIGTIVGILIYNFIGKIRPGLIRRIVCE
jgi:VanZ family protein